MVIPVILLTVLGTVGSFPTDAAHFGILLTELTRCHLLLSFLQTNNVNSIWFKLEMRGINYNNWILQSKVKIT